MNILRIISISLLQNVRISDLGREREHFLEIFKRQVDARIKGRFFYMLLPISLWPMLGKENRNFYTRHSNNNDRWVHDIISALGSRRGSYVLIRLPSWISGSIV